MNSTSALNCHSSKCQLFAVVVKITYNDHNMVKVNNGRGHDFKLVVIFVTAYAVIMSRFFPRLGTFCGKLYDCF